MRKQWYLINTLLVLIILIMMAYPAEVTAQESDPPDILVIIEKHVPPRTESARRIIATVSDVWNYGCSPTSTYIEFHPAPAIISTLAVDSTNTANWFHILSHSGLDGYATCYYGYCRWVLCGKAARNDPIYNGWSYRLWDDPYYGLRSGEKGEELGGSE